MGNAIQTINPPSGESRKHKRILLILLPFWTPSIPPLGISLMKALLQEYGFQVKNHDANMDFEFREIYEQYFSIIRSVIPAYKQGNFFNIGMDVMRNHMMAHINYTDEEQYKDLIKRIIYQHYFCDIEDEKVDGLIDVLDRYYALLKDFIHNYIRDYDPQLIGLSVFSGNLASSIFCFREIKKINPEIETVMGGGTFSMEMAKDNPNFARFLKNEGHNVDKIFIGEGDLLFLRFLEGHLDPDKKIYQLSDLSEKNLGVDELPVPDFSDLNMSMYPQIGYWTSRSCPYQCSFCSETIYWGRYRKKEAVKMVNDLKALSTKFNSQVFMMGDSLLNPVIDKLATEMIHQNAKIYYDGYLRTDPPVTKLENTMK